MAMIRTLVLLATAVLLLVPAGCRQWNNPFDPQNNRPPSVPSNPSPGDGSAERDTVLALSWTGGDPDSGDVVTYSLYFGADSEPPLLVRDLDSTAFNPGFLTLLTEYHWRVVARDRIGDTTAGPPWGFTTIAASDTNLPPYVPSNPLPDSGATGRTRNPVLIWDGGDPNPDDTVTYDLYFGTSSTPPLLAQGLTQPLYVFSTLDYDAEYYWKAVARDRDSALTEGPVWQFKVMRRVTITEPGEYVRWRMGSAQRIVWSGGADRSGPKETPNAECRMSSSGIANRNPVLTRSKPVRTSRGGGRSPGADGADSTAIFFSTDNGSSWIRHGRATAQGQYDWTVPGPTTIYGRAQVRAYADGKYETGTSPRFEVYDSLLPSAITITAPAAGTRWEAGTVHQVTWDGGVDGVDSSVVYYSTDNGSLWDRQGVAAIPGSFAWGIPGQLTDEARIQVRAYCRDDSVAGTSEQFRVTGPAFPDTVVATVAVGEKPRALCWNSTNNKVYVSNRDGSSVTVIDGVTNSVIATVPVGSFPYGLVWNSTDNKVYVANEASRTVTVIDGATEAVLVESIPVGVAPRDIVWSSTSNKVYVGNYSSGNAVTVIDCNADTVVATVVLSGRPRDLAWNPVTNRVYAACYTVDHCDVIDCSTDQLVASVPTGGKPCFVTVDGSRNKVYVANELSGSISVIDGNTNTVVRTIPGLSGPCALCWNETSDKVYSADSGVSSVTVIDASDYRVLVNVGVGQQPRALTWASLVNVVYVANYVSGNVTVIGGDSNRSEATATVGSSPIALCWNENDRKVYVANYDGGTVSVLGVVQ